MSSVQIFVPNYNGSRFINESIQSILNQTYRDFEIIVIDNNSSDDSIEILSSIDDERLKVQKFDLTVNIGGNFNRCLELATADYFCLLHSDDIYDVNFISEMIMAFEFDPIALMAHSNFNCIDQNGRLFIDSKYKLKQQKFSKERFFSKNSTIELNELIMGNYIICPSMVFRREVISKVGYFNENYSFALDWDYSLRILNSNYKIVSVSKKLINYRISNLNATNLAVNNNKKYEEHLKILDTYRTTIEKKIIELSKLQLYNIIIWDLKDNLLKRNYALAHFKFEFIKKVLKVNPVLILILKLILNLKYIGGLILNFFAESILFFKR